MKILFYSLYANFLPPFGTQLELIRKEQQQGNKIFVVRCNGILKSCHANHTHNPIKCARCRERSDVSFEHLGIPSDHIFDLKHFRQTDEFEIPIFPDTDSLLKFRFDAIELGRGVASTLISRSRDFEINTEKYGELIDLYLRMAIDSYLSLKELLESLKPDLIYVYNGRQPEDRPMIQLAEKMGINYRSHVSGSDITKYRIFENGVVHYLKSIQKMVVDTINDPTVSDEQKVAIGSDWFEKNASNRNANWKDYTKNQNQTLLPDGFNQDKINVAIFNSSEDEMKTFADWQTTLYKNQNEALRKICEALLPHPQIMLYLRVHPNLDKVVNTQTKEILGFNYANLKVVRADSEVSTYGLIKASNKVVTFGSTTGVEATYMGKPSILFGKTLYDHLDCVYKPESIEELVELVLDTHLPAKSKANAARYGFYVATFGQQHDILKFETNGDHIFEGVVLNKFRPKVLIYILQQMAHFRTWLRMRALKKRFGF